MRVGRRRSPAISCGAFSLMTVLFAAGILTHGQAGPAAQRRTLVVDDAALSDDAGGSDWLAYGRTYSEQRFSPLAQINDRTVSRLRPDWVLELPGDRGWYRRRSSSTACCISSAA